MKSFTFASFLFTLVFAISALCTPQSHRMLLLCTTFYVLKHWGETTLCHCIFFSWHLQFEEKKNPIKQSLIEALERATFFFRRLNADLQLFTHTESTALHHSMIICDIFVVNCNTLHWDTLHSCHHEIKGLLDYHGTDLVVLFNPTNDSMIILLQIAISLSDCLENVRLSFSLPN